MRKELVDIEVPEVLPPSEDGVFKTLLTHPAAKLCLLDVIASNTGLSVKEATVRNTELPINEIIATKEEIKMAYGLLTSISQDEDERARFRARRKFQMDMEHSRIVSFEEGELKSKLEIARNLLSNKVSLDIISRSTGLSLDEIQTLTN